MAAIEHRWVPHPEVTLQRDGSAAILLHLRTQQYFELNGTALRIWELLASGTAPDGIAEALVEEFTVEPQEAREAVESLLNLLAADDLIRRADGHRAGRVERWLGRLRRG